MADLPVSGLIEASPRAEPAAAARPTRFGRRARRLIRRLLTRLYEARLLREVHRGPAPRHIGIILDGNRRHAREQGVRDFHAIYAAGAGKLDDVLDWCAELGVGAVTLWVCSTDNLARPAEEVSGILAAIEGKMNSLVADPRIHRLGVRVNAIGRLDLLPASLAAALGRAAAATAGNRQLTLTIAANYGGREEIADAMRSLLRECAANGLTAEQAVSKITPEAIGRHLYAPGLPDPDLIIRTSGELRLSGFLLWQSVYSEFHFTDVYWPEFRHIDLLRAIRTFQSRQRRFGR
ncbi:MAG: di-trans,poly-cis-decaprenylcistransferase [Rhodospirillales bacterium]|nr:di-trans,poly-cis-decaprenylcistransferase [Rhodospirillales bacterium]